jgi:hypothetical protein
MYNNWTDGSDFTTLSGQMELHESLPPSGTQYIESINSGTCFGQLASFVLVVESVDDKIVSFSFTAHPALAASWGAYAVDGGTYSVQQDGFLKVSVTIASNGVEGTQDVIMVVIHDAPRPPGAPDNDGD